ncbi:MAG: DUF4368 domain-containing protein [Butyricicoccus pullicaecorum]|nr:DUF4368 domain-containing protein [Butyricicoccus pullicaecorum]
MGASGAVYSTIEELDEAVLNRLISKILVGEVKKIDGKKTQEVRIAYTLLRIFQQKLNNCMIAFLLHGEGLFFAHF